MGHNIRRILLHIILHINYLEQNRIAEKPIYVEKNCVQSQDMTYNNSYSHELTCII